MAWVSEVEGGKNKIHGYTKKKCVLQQPVACQSSEDAAI
jgi:hypothetical protein